MSELMLTPVFSVSEQRVIRRAMRLLEKYQRNPGESFLSSDATKTWLQLHLARQEREMFVVLRTDCWNTKRYFSARLTAQKYIPVRL